MTSVTSVWPFSQWGIDLVGPLPEAPGKVKFLIVAIDYFTKWVEAKPLASITGKHVEKFVWEFIICRFGIPHVIITDNGKQFAEGIFPQFCKKLHIRQNFTSVYHPQSNGQVEVTNRDIIRGIERRLGRSHTGWVDELPLVLWAHRTTPKRSNGETPFSLVYGTEAVLPAEIQVSTARTQNFDSETNSDGLRTNLDLLEERREIAALREASYKRQIEKYYNKRVQPSSFKPGDLVLRLNSASKAEFEGKLGPAWEGPYHVCEAYGNGAYKLATMDGTPVPRTWNSTNLRRFHA